MGNKRGCAMKTKLLAKEQEMTKATIQRLLLFGFDQSRHVPFTHSFRIDCSQCSALVINGVACHETGCPNARHECKGCNGIVSRNVTYCEDCR